MSSQSKRNPIRSALSRVPILKRLYWWAYVDRPIGPIKIPHGFLMTATRDSSHRAMLRSEFEEEETAVLVRCLRRADCFVDVGANIGYFTCLARAMGRSAIAFEPQLNNLSYLYRNLRLNGWDDTEVYPVALGDHNGIISMYYQTSTIVSAIRDWGSYPAQEQNVSIVKLDDILGTRLCGKRLVIKIDVEGFEYSVLRGATEVLGMSPRPVWMVEIWLNEGHLGRVNPNFLATFELFWRNGYQARTADRYERPVTRTDVLEWIERGECSSGTTNYLFESSDG